ncbi:MULTISPECIES: cytochrome P450 [unclassified Minwuia]|jgi:cytochrome P450|uniref:cytochrome P450 n=1 Tax=unclassified Minwuia TaxID=2618799 RepID=UPI002479A8C2|nr:MULTISPECIES: cytochrome P450 [unclassified Minwuia]
MNEQTPVADAPLFNPFSPEFLRNPYPSFELLRENQPLMKTPLGFWVASRYADVQMILKDRRFGKGFDERMKMRNGDDVFDNPVYANMRTWMLVQDPPDHSRLRGLVSKAFTARRIDGLRPQIQTLVDELLDRAAPRGRMDFIRDFAYPLPVNVICDMLGIPPEDRSHFEFGSKISGRLIDPTPVSAEELQEIGDGFSRQEAYFRDLFSRRRAEPQDDLTTVLVQAEEAGERLTEAELVGNVILLFGAGHETTVNLLGNGLLALLQNPDEYAKLRDNPDLVPGAIEEMLRFDSSVQMTGRTAMEDVEVNGVTIPKGDHIINLLGSANRDGAAFDAPESFRVDRKDVRPMSFGGGIHFCLGAQLARVEADIAFRSLLARLPDLRLEKPDEPDWRPTFTLRGLTSLPIAWG